MSSVTNFDEKNDLTNLFPAPKLFTSLNLPHSTVLSGATAESTTILRKSLQDNHKRWHCFFDAERGFHNHAAHSLLALWFLGADAEILKSAYAEECSYLRPTFASPDLIDKSNWTEHLGEEKYYDAYLTFFKAELAARGPIDVVEHYIFSTTANHPKDGRPVEMLNRFLEALFHPLIHVGYGYEFGIPGMIAEGLASAAMHGASSIAVIPATGWKEEISKDTAPSCSLLNILARIIGNPEIKPIQDENLRYVYSLNVKTYASKILKQVNSWKIDFSTKEGLSKALEEIVWFVTLMYAVPGYMKDQEIYKADFFYMHLVTSSMFLPCIVAQLKPKSQELLLKSFVASCLGWYIRGGKPDLNIEAFFADTKTTKPLLTQISPTARISAPLSHNALPDSSAISPNPWTEIIHLAILHPDDHVPKLQRTLFHYAQLYGTREAGCFKKDAAELKGAEKIDGSLFVRAANLTAVRLNRSELCVMFVGKKDFWYRDGFYKE